MGRNSTEIYEILAKSRRRQMLHMKYKAGWLMEFNGAKVRIGQRVPDTVEFNSGQRVPDPGW